MIGFLDDSGPDDFDPGVFLEDSEVDGFGITAYSQIDMCALCHQPGEEYAEKASIPDNSALPGGYIIGWLTGGLCICRDCSVRLVDLIDACETCYSNERRPLK